MKKNEYRMWPNGPTIELPAEYHWNAAAQEVVKNDRSWRGDLMAFWNLQQPPIPLDEQPTRGTGDGSRGQQPEKRMKPPTESDAERVAGCPPRPCSPLFEDRVPEAAATQLAIVLAWLTECNLATLEEMRSRKSTPKYSISRQESICEKAVEHCRDMNVPPRGLLGRTTTRLARILQENS